MSSGEKQPFLPNADFSEYHWLLTTPSTDAFLPALSQGPAPPHGPGDDLVAAQLYQCPLLNSPYPVGPSLSRGCTNFCGQRPDTLLD